MSNDAPLSDEDMRKELQNIQLKMNATADESLESTRRMVTLCEESKDAGIRTLVMLDEQGEQIDRIGEGMDQINQDMRAAEKNLEGMEKCCGLCVLPWKKSKNFERRGEYATAWKKDEDGKIGGDGPRVVVGDQSQVPQAGFVTRITNDAREDEMEENLAAVSGMVGNLRNMAIDMNSEITQQNKQLDRINIQVAPVAAQIPLLRLYLELNPSVDEPFLAEANKTRIGEANKRANKLLKD